MDALDERCVMRWVVGHDCMQATYTSPTDESQWSFEIPAPDVQCEKSTGKRASTWRQLVSD
jgi:hypothetical protein